MAEYEFHYSKFPALKAYIDRVGAEQVNFKRFLVRELNDLSPRYRRVIATIRIKDGAINCDNDEFAPTDDEAKAIADELKSVVFPKSVKATPVEVEELLKSGQVTGTAFSFYDSERKEVIMVQERRDRDDGGKDYPPWTLFSTPGKAAVWRMMEPDGKLPFWKPRERRNRANLMIHEGAKAAAFCDDLVNNPERRNELKVHPFADDLVDCEHWGVIGGAHAVERSDYDELRRENIDGGDVIYICDNDDPGMEAVKKFSFKYGKRMYAVRFGEKWPPGWDLADPVPRDLINDYGRTDKSLMDMLDPATWATKPVGKSHVLKDDFASEWAHTIDPEMYIWKRDPRRVFSDRGFNNLIAPFTQGNKKPCDLLKEHSFGGKIGTVERNPGRRTGLHHNDEGKTCFNLHVAKRHRPYAAGENPDLSPWENLLKQLFPLPSDLWLTKCFLATLIARPGIKMKYGLLLVSAVQGVGKTTLGMALDRVLGSWNVTWPDEDEIVDKQWTYWLDGALVFVNEIYSGHSAKAYNKLRSVITDKIIRVVKKFIGNCNMENHIHVIACSNSTRALKLDNTDRRWLVPKVTDKKWPSDEATRFYKWLYNEEGDRAIYYWAEKFLKDNPDAVVAEGAEAPPTSAKDEMMRDQYSPGMEVLDAKFAFIKDAYAGDVMLPACTQKRINERKNGKINGEPLPLLEVERVIELAERGEHFVMLANEGCEAIKRLLYNGRHSDKLESLHTVCNVASNAGFCVGKERIKSGPLKYRSRQGRIISLCPKLAAMVGSELANVPIIDLAQLAVELEPPPAF